MTGRIQYLVLSGGGMKGLAFVGCLRALEEFDVMRHIQGFAGTSVGSILAFLFCLGYRSIELQEIFAKVDFEKTQDIHSDNILNYFEYYGFETGNEIIRILRIFLRKKWSNDDITFDELYQHTGLP